MQQSQAGLPYFLVHDTKIGKNVPNEHKMYQRIIKFPQWLQNIANGHKIYQHFSITGPTKFTQIGIFGLKRNHLATLVTGRDKFGNIPTCPFTEQNEIS
jgi:hypothetical protein